MMLLQGLRMLLTNWRLCLLEALPAIWIWAAMLDLKVHLVKGLDFNLWYGPGALSAILGIAIISAVAIYLNTVFALAVTSHPIEVRAAFGRSRSRATPALVIGSTVGLALGVCVVLVPRWGLGWFSFSLGIVVAVLMVTYVTVPARLVGASKRSSRRDGILSAIVAGTVGAIVCAPAYVMGRVGIRLLDSQSLLVLGAIVLSVGFALHAGASGAIKAVKVSATLVKAPTKAPSV